MKGKPVNRSELAAIFGVAGTTVDAWIRAGCPVVKRATGRGRGMNRWVFDSAAVGEWLRERAVANAIGNSEKLDREALELRRLRAMAEIAEHELGQMRRELVAVDVAAEAVRRDYAAIQARLLSMPSKLAPELAAIAMPAEARAVLEREVREVLDELSGGELDGDSRSGAGGALSAPYEAPSGAAIGAMPAAEADRERVGG
jgi:phage terminase Nu1 subunit (DNA packaging protein)